MDYSNYTMYNQAKDPRSIFQVGFNNLYICLKSTKPKRDWRANLFTKELWENRIFSLQLMVQMRAEMKRATIKYKENIRNIKCTITIKHKITTVQQYGLLDFTEYCRKFCTIIQYSMLLQFTVFALHCILMHKSNQNPNNSRTFYPDH